MRLRQRYYTKSSVYPAIKKWEQELIVFTLTKEIIATHPDIWIAFVAEKDETYGTFIADVHLSPVDVTDGNLKTASELKVAKLGESLKETGRRPHSKDILKIDINPDRFYVQIPEITGVDRVFIKVATIENPDERYNDNETEIELTSKNGRYFTPSMILVSDDVDNKLEDGKPNNRAFKIQLGGKVKIAAIRIISNGTSSEVQTAIKIPVLAKKQVHINAVILSDSGVLAADVHEDIRLANERYAQVGLRLILDGEPITKPTPAWWKKGSRVYVGARSGGLGDDARWLITNYGTSSIDDITVFYVKQCVDYPTLRDTQGFSVPEFRVIDASGVIAGNTGFANNAFISRKRAPFRAIAHEVGHLLTNAKHYGINYPDYLPSAYLVYHNLMNGFGSSDEPNKLHSSKRLNIDQQSWIWGHRTVEDAN